MRLVLVATFLAALALEAPVMADTSAAASNAAADDPYLWLENIEGQEALAWVRERNAKSEAAIKADPHFEPFKAEMLKILNAKDRIPYGPLRRGYVYNFWQDDVHVRGVWRRTPLASYRTDDPQWEILLDVDALAKAENKSWVFQGADCLPPEFARCLVELSIGGKDATEVREYDIASKSFVGDGFLLPEAKSATSWESEKSLLVGTDWGEGSLTASGYPRVVKRLVRGAGLDAAVTVFEGKPEDVGVFPSALQTRTERHMTITRAVSFFESEHYLVLGDRVVQAPLPRRVEVAGLFKGKLLFSVKEDWTPPGAAKAIGAGALLATDFDTMRVTGKLGPVETVYVPGPRGALQSADVAGDRLVLVVMDNVASKVFVGDVRDGRIALEPVATPEAATVSVVAASPFETTAFLNYETMLEPDTLVILDPVAKTLEPIKRLPARFDASSLDVEQYEAVSRDGTKIPYFVLAPKDRAGPAPTLLYGYGGFEVPLNPSYSATIGKLWAGNGGVYVLANIRGGGEFGPAWHEAARKTNRQRGFDDFIAVGEDLVKRGITEPKTLGIMGGSNGGLLTGAVMVQRPDLFGAVVSQVPLLDMMRFHMLLAGASWVDEYGSPEVPEERAALLEYSPYQNVKQDADYPPVLFITSTKDDRVHPGHARKMVARMEAQGHDVLYFEAIDGGHNAATNQIERAERTALEFTFLAQKLGLK